MAFLCCENAKFVAHISHIHYYFRIAFLSTKDKRHLIYIIKEYSPKNKKTLNKTI